MQFSANEQQAMIQRGVRAFASTTLRTGAADRDLHASTPATLLSKLADLGVFGLHVSEQMGGLGLDKVAGTLAIEELACVDAGVALLVLQHQLALNQLRNHDRLAELVSGERRAVWAHGEDALHSDAASVTTTATADGDGWRLDGEKPNVFGALAADVVLLTAQTPEGLTSFVLDLQTPGVTLRKDVDALGLRSSGVATIVLAGVQVPKTAMVDQPGAAMAHITPALLQARLGVAAIAVGIAREALRLGGRYALDRQQFGKPIAQFQPIQWQVANSAVELDLARLLLHRAAWTQGTGKNAEAVTAMARLTATEMATRVTDRAIQMHGGYGYTREFTVERLFRDAWTLDGLFGSPGLQRIRLARLLAA